MDRILKKIIHYLDTHPYLRLATVSAAGTPVAHTVAYVSRQATVYFITDKESRKARNILQNPAVAYTVDENYIELTDIQGVQMEGEARLVTEPAEVETAAKLLIDKFPAMRDIPQNPDLVYFRIDPKKGYFIDCTVDFGHRDKIVFD